jgi:cytochrome P450
MERMRREHGDVVTLVEGAPSYLFAFGETSNRTVLSDPDTFQNPEPSDTPLRLIPGSALSRLYNGLIQLNGPAHRCQRKIMAQAMNRNWRAELLVEMAAIIRRRVATWPADGTIDLAAECREISMQVAHKVLLGIDPNGTGRTIAAAMHEWTRLVFSPLVMLLPFDVRSLPYARLQQLSGEIEIAIRTMIAARRERMDNANDVLGALIGDAHAGRLPENMLIGQTNFLFMAGHLTTASAMAWRCSA